MDAGVQRWLGKMGEKRLAGRIGFAGGIRFAGWFGRLDSGVDGARRVVVFVILSTVGPAKCVHNST